MGERVRIPLIRYDAPQGPEWSRGSADLTPGPAPGDRTITFRQPNAAVGGSIRSRDKDRDVTLHDINDYRDAKTSAAPCWLTLIWPAFRTPEGRMSSLSHTIHVPDGDFAAAIGEARAVAEAGGGVYLTEADANGDFWCLPWPPAAIRIRGQRPGPGPF